MCEVEGCDGVEVDVDAEERRRDEEVVVFMLELLAVP